MASKHFEIKVGVFVLFCLLVLGALVVSFSKGFSLVKSTYDVKLRTSDVGGIKARAGVLMAGVRVGTVTRIQLMSDGRSAVVTMKIDNEFQIHRDAAFQIEQAGLLGDQYISISPTGNVAPMLADGDEITTAPATDFKQMLRSAAGLVERLDQVAASLQTAAGRIDKLLLNESNMVALSESVTNLRDVTRRATNTLAGAEGLVASVHSLVLTNSDSVSYTMTNLAQFSEELKKAGTELNSIVAANRADVGTVVKNLEQASGIAKDLLVDVQAGKGVAGGLLRDDELKRDLQAVMSNLTQLSSNLNRNGLFYKPKTPRLSEPATIPERGRTPQ